MVSLTFWQPLRSNFLLTEPVSPPVSCFLPDVAPQCDKLWGRRCQRHAAPLFLPAIPHSPSGRAVSRAHDPFRWAIEPARDMPPMPRPVKDGCGTIPGGLRQTRPNDDGPEPIEGSRPGTVIPCVRTIDSSMDGRAYRMPLISRAAATPAPRAYRSSTGGPVAVLSASPVRRHAPPNGSVPRSAALRRRGFPTSCGYREASDATSRLPLSCRRTDSPARPLR